MPPFGTRNARDLQIVDAVLTNIARAYKPAGFIYGQVFPSIPVQLDAGLYPIFDGFFDDDVDNKVSDRAETPEVDFQWSTDTYLCEDFRLKASYTKKEERQAHSILMLRQNKLEVVLTRMAIRRERRAAVVLQDSGTTGGQLTGGSHTPATKWDTGAAATVEADIKTAKIAVYRKTGMTTNTIVLPFEVAYAIAMDPEVRKQIRYDATGKPVDYVQAGEQILPGSLHGHRVIIPAGAMRNTAKEGAPKVLADIWGKSARLLYLPSGQGGWGIPSTGYSFVAEGEAVDRWRENDPPVEYVRAWECRDEKVCGPELGYEIKATIT